MAALRQALWRLSSVIPDSLDYFSPWPFMRFGALMLTAHRFADKTAVRTLTICNLVARNPVGIDLLAPGTDQ